MKRELILDEVKYDGEYFTTKILKQTHRGVDFTPDGWSYKHKDFHLRSDGGPELYPTSLCVRGSNSDCDNNTIKTKDKVLMDKALATVKAYNEEFSDYYVKPDWCCHGDDPNDLSGMICGCRNWHRATDIDTCKDATCPHIKPEFLVDKDLETVKNNIKEFVDDHIEKIREIAEYIDDSITVDEFMAHKKELMLLMVDLPIATDHCYYCEKNNLGIDGLDCLDCSYAVDHGVCDTNSSVYKLILGCMDTLESAIEKY